MPAVIAVALVFAFVTSAGMGSLVTLNAGRTYRLSFSTLQIQGEIANVLRLMNQTPGYRNAHLEGAGTLVVDVTQSRQRDVHVGKTRHDFPGDGHLILKDVEPL